MGFGFQRYEKFTVMKISRCHGITQLFQILLFTITFKGVNNSLGRSNRACSQRSSLYKGLYMHGMIIVSFHTTVYSCNPEWDQMFIHNHNHLSLKRDLLPLNLRVFICFTNFLRCNTCNLYLCSCCTLLELMQQLDYIAHQR